MWQKMLNTVRKIKKLSMKYKKNKKIIKRDVIHINGMCTGKNNK